MTRNTPQWRATAQNAGLVLGSCLLCFIVIEMVYRVLDPFPFISRDEINHTEHGNLSMYDEVLGWKGVPGAQSAFVTTNNRIWLAHNTDGFRDIEHKTSTDKPAIVFLGDSFTWGYEVEFEEMFVNRLRDRLPRYDLINLAHRGYGTDQALLTLQRMRADRPIELVVLMFSENDVADNNSRVKYAKPKPKYDLINNSLVLTGVPVAKTEAWVDPSAPEPGVASWKAKVFHILLRSHVLYALYFQYSLMRRPEAFNTRVADPAEGDLTLTVRILEQLKNEVERRGARLVIFFIPSKREVEHLDEDPPYQLAIADLCRMRGIQSYNLAPDFESTRLRTYFRLGNHWNARGHDLAAKAVYRHLTQDPLR